LANQQLSLTRLPNVLAAEPDPIEFRLTHADRHSQIGVTAGATPWR